MSLTDNSMMPFGEHAGKKMENVPASWLHWLWYERQREGRKHDDIEAYIEENWSTLKQEASHLIWE